jgi:hypothetical protein
MNTFIVKINPEYKYTLKRYGNIVFDSSIIKGLIGIETNLTMEQIRNLPHVINVEEDRDGYLLNKEV